MREIKFRCWDKLKETLVYSSCSQATNDMYFPWGFQIGRLGAFANLEFMQYTGLKDKNGKEIYEGDIILFGINAKHQEIVEWKIIEDHEYGEPMYIGYDLLPSSEECYEIIGNIYENPELIEEKQ